MNTETYKDFANKIDEFDKNLTKMIDELNKLNELKKSETNDAEKTIEAYSKQVIKNQNEVLIEYKNTLSKLFASLKKKVSDENDTSNKTDFKSFNDALKEFKENDKVIKKALKEINNYKFNEIAFDYEFNGEEAIINGEKYNAPNFPTVGEKEIWNDKQNNLLLQEFYKVCINQLECVDYLIDNSEFKSSVNNAKKQSKDISFKDIETKSAKQIDKKEKELLDYYNDVKIFTGNQNKILKDSENLETLYNFNEYRTNIFIGKFFYEYQNYDKYAKTIKSLKNDDIIINKKSKFPFFIDVLKKENFIINTNEDNKYVARFIDDLVLSLMSSVPARKMNLIFVDIDDSNEYDFAKKYSKDYLTKNKLLTIINDKDSFKKEINNLKMHIVDTKSKLGKNNCEDIFDYYKSQKDMPIDFYLLVIVGYPKYFDRDTSELLKNLMTKDKNYGLYTILVNNKKMKPMDAYAFNDDDNKEFINSISKTSSIFDYNQTNHDFIYDGKSFEVNKTIHELDLNVYFNDLAKRVEASKGSNIIKLESIIDNRLKDKPYYENIEIPVGKIGKNIVYFDLDISKTGKSSAIIAGATGSGKSSFLHTIILSGAYNYSPEELEFYLIDFKDGVEFAPYKNKEGGINIPHVSFLSLKNRIEDGFDILNKIGNEKIHRNELFKKVGATDLKSYNESAKVKNGELPILRRLIVIIDEYQNFFSRSTGGSSSSNVILSSNCSEYLISLLKEIRNVGISLILASQEISLDKDASNQIYNRYIFDANESVIISAFPESNTSKIKNDLSNEKGLVYRSENGSKASDLFVAAYAGKTNEKEQQNLAKEIREKWSKYKNNELIISRNEEILPINKANVSFVDFTEIEESEKNIINNYFGRSALSNRLISVPLDESKPYNYLIFGDIQKARNIEASIGLSFLYNLKSLNFKFENKNLYYIDPNTSNYAIKNKSPFELYNDKLSKFITYVNSSDEIVSSINEVYKEFELRKEESKKRIANSKAPILLIINSYEFLNELNDDDQESIDDSLDSLVNGSSFSSGDNSTICDKVYEIYRDGYNYNVFVLIHTVSGEFIIDSGQKFDCSRVICCDDEQISYCKIDKEGNTIEIEDLDKNYVVLFPNVYKVRPFIFNKSDVLDNYINKYVEVLTDA